MTQINIEDIIESIEIRINCCYDFINTYDVRNSQYLSDFITEVAKAQEVPETFSEEYLQNVTISNVTLQEICDKTRGQVYSFNELIQLCYIHYTEGIIRVNIETLFEALILRKIQECYNVCSIHENIFDKIKEFLHQEVDSETLSVYARPLDETVAKGVQIFSDSLKEDYIKLETSHESDETLYTITTEDKCKLTLNKAELRQLKIILNKIEF